MGPSICNLVTTFSCQPHAPAALIPVKKAPISTGYEAVLWTLRTILSASFADRKVPTCGTLPLEFSQRGAGIVNPGRSRSRDIWTNLHVGKPRYQPSVLPPEQKASAAHAQTTLIGARWHQTTLIGALTAAEYLRAHCGVSWVAWVAWVAMLSWKQRPVW